MTYTIDWSLVRIESNPNQTKETNITNSWVDSYIHPLLNYIGWFPSEEQPSLDIIANWIKHNTSYKIDTFLSTKDRLFVTGGNEDEWLSIQNTFFDQYTITPDVLLH